MTHTFDWNRFLTSDPATATLIECTESAVDDLVLTAPRQSGIDPRIVRGGRCATPAALFHEWAAALQFPHYFGENWDAFEECLADLDWLPGDCHVIVITTMDRVLADAPADFKSFAGILAAIAAQQNRDNDGPPTRFLLHTAHGKAKITRARFAGSGLEIA